MSFSEWTKQQKKKEEEKKKSSSSSSADSTKGGKQSFSEWTKQQKANTVDGWLTSSENIIRSVQRNTQKWHDEKAYKSSFEEISALLAQADGWRKQFAGNSEAISVIDSVVSALSDAKNYAFKSRKYYSQFKDEVAYKAAVEQAKADAKRWTELTGGYDPTKHQAEGKAGWGDYVATQDRIAQNKAQAEEEKPWWEKMLGYLGDVGQDTSLPVHTTETVRQGYRDWESDMQKPNERWTEEQQDTYGYLWRSSRAKAAEYAYAVNNMLNTQYENAEREDIRNWATDNFGAGAAHTVGAILTSPLGMADYLGDLIAQDTLGYVPETDGNITPFEYSQEVTGGITEHLNKNGTLNDDIPIIGGKGLGDVYGLGTSIAQSSVAAYTGGSAQALISFFGSAAASGVDDAVSRGVTGESAVLYGTAVGTAEALAEMIGIDNLMKIGSSQTVKALLLNLLKQGAAEGLEEGVTNFLSNVADNVIIGDKSNFYIRVQAYMNAGLSEEEAKKKAWTELWEDMAFDMLGGFVSGAVHAGPQTAYQTYASNYNPGSSIMNADGGVDALKNLANQVAGVSEDKMKASLIKQAGNVSSKVATGSGIGKVGAAIKNANNAVKVGKLYNTVQTANNLANASANQADIAKSLQRKGFNAETASDIASALVARYNGKELTKAQAKLLKSVEGNKVVSDAISNIVTNELSTMGQRSQNIRSFQSGITVGKINNAIKETIRKNTTAGQFTPTGKYEVSDKGRAINTETGDEIDIKGVSAISRGKMLLELADGTTIDAKSVSFASNNDALVYEAIANLGDNISAENANKLIAKYDGSKAEVFARGIAQAYTYGFYGIDRSELTGENALASELTKEQRNYAYGLGEQYRSVKDTADKAKARARKAPGEKGVFYRDKDGNATDIRSYLKQDGRVLNEMQITGIEFMEKMSKMMGVRFNVFESWEENGTRYYLDENGEVTEGNPNGFYDPKTGEIYIDLFAGNDFQGTMLFTVAHELTHFMRQWSPEHFTKISKLVFSHAGFKGSVSSLVADKMNGKRKLDYDTALEEVVADGMETILKDGKVAEFMVDVKKTDSKLWAKLKEWFKNFAEFLKKMVDAYSGQSAQTVEGQKVADFSKKLLNQIEQIWAEGAVSAGENYQEAMDEYSRNLDEDLDSLAENMEEGNYSLQGEVMLSGIEYNKELSDRYEENLESDSSNVLFSEKNYPIDADMQDIVDDAIRDMSGNNTIRPINAVENRAINKIANLKGADDGWKGKFTGGLHTITYQQIRHALSGHSNPLREALRAQLALTPEDVARTLTAIKNNRARVQNIPTRTSTGDPSILQAIPVNGYTLYAEAIAKPSGKSGVQNLEGKTIYKAPTPPTASGSATSTAPLLKRQSEVLYEKSSTSSATLSSVSFVADKNGDAAKLYYVEADGKPVSDSRNGNLILLTSYRTVLSANQNGNGSIVEGYAKIRNPYIITADHRVFSDSKEKVNDILRDIRNKGYDGLIFDYTTGDNYAVMVFKGNQIEKDISGYQKALMSDRDTSYLDAIKRGDMETVQRMVYEDAERAGFAVRGKHGTTNLFYVFDTAKSNIENDWGRGIYATTSEEDAQVNYASDDGADLTNRIERLAEMMEHWEEYEDMDYEQRVEAARNQLSQGENRMLNVAYRMENPVVVEQGNGGTFFTYESEYDEELDEYSEPSGTLVDVVQRMQSIIEEDYEWASYDAEKLVNLYDEAIDFGGLSAIQLQSSVKDWLVDVTDEDGNIAGSEILRAAFEQMGYDGIVDKSVPYKFGELSGRRYGGMRGVTKDTTHFIAFKSSQVKLTDPITYDDKGNIIPLSQRFNTEKDDIRYSDRLEEEHSRIVSELLDVQAQMYKAEEAKKALQSNGELLDAMFAVMQAEKRTPEYREARAKFEEVSKRLGVKGAEDRYNELRDRYTKLKAEEEKAYKALAEKKEADAVAKSGMTESDYFRKVAIKEFGYTPMFLDAGYMLPNGKLLNFSGEKGKHFGTRGTDHRGIGVIYEVTSGSAAMTKFMNDGNIRVMAETPGVDISSVTQPTSEQYAAIKRFVREYAKENYFAVDISDKDGRSIGNYEYKGSVNADRVVNDIKHFFQTGEVRKSSGLAEFLHSPMYSDRDNAPTFYSHMAKVVDGVKQEKLGAASVVSMLRGRGVKAEEIKWSGIEEWLAGKKSVTKAELQEFIAGSMLQIEESVRDSSKANNVKVKKLSKDSIGLYIDGKLSETFTKDADDHWWPSNPSDSSDFYLDSDHILNEYEDTYGNNTKWSEYKLKGGKNYREITFKMPDSTYSNVAMQAHWGDGAKGILAHARIQDFKVDGKKMLFVEEIQSDYHNEGNKHGYRKGGQKTDLVLRKESTEAYKEFYSVVEDMVYNNANWENDNATYYAHPVVVAEMFEGNESHFDKYGFTEEQREKIRSMVADEATRQEALRTAPKHDAVPDAPFKDNYHEYVLKRLIRDAAEKGYDSIGWTTAQTQAERWSEEFAEGYRIEYDQDIPKFLKKYGKQWGATVGKTTLRNGTEVWSMAITDSMKESVLTEGQPLYSDRILMGSLFSGGGTLEAGLAYQMLDKEFGVEYDGKIASVYADNHGDHIQVGKVEDFDISKYDDIFYLHASPVCHNFSKAKHGAKELQMDIDSAKATAKHLETAMPQVFTVENAPAYRKSESLKIITDKLTEIGYKWDVDVYNSADYGSATSRNRVILRAVKDGELPPKPTKQERTNSWDKVTRDLWDTLPKATLRPSFISAIENTRNLPILDANGKVNVNKPLLILTTTSGHMVTYCWEGDICPTLTTKCGEARLVMPDGNIYSVTPEFMGRIQGLPDDYKYPKEKTRAFTIIGNGIPTHLTKAVVGGVLDSAYEQTHGKALYSDRDYVAYDRTAILKEETVDRWLRAYATKSSPGYAQAYIAYMNPDQFLELTTSDYVAKKRIESESYELDEEKFAKATSEQPLFLDIDHETGEVYGHEGRHRCVALQNAGIENVPVLLFDTSNKYSKEDITSILLKGQFNKYHQEFVFDAIPLSYGNRDRVIQNFATQSSSQRFWEKTGTKDTLRFQDRADNSVSNRALLANAFEGIAKPEELPKIQEYKDKVALINEEEKKLRELNEQIKELSFAKGPRDNKRIKALRFDAVQAANRINTYDKQLLRLEASEPLQKVLNREKRLAYKKAEQRGKEALAEYKAKVEAQQKETAEKWRESRKTAVAKARETAEKRDARAKLQKLVLDTVKWISYPAKTDVKCPDILKKPYEAFLQGIDLSSKRLANGGEATKNDLRLANAMDSLATAIDRVMLSQDPSQEVDKVLDIGYLDLPADFVQKLRDMTESIKSMMVEGEYVVNTMTAEEVRKLSQMIRTLNHAIKTMSNLYANLRFANVEALGFDTMDFLDAVGEIEKTGGMKDFVQWDNALPFYAFKRFGKGGESIFEGLMDAQDKLAFLAQGIFDFQEKTWTGKEAKAWSEDTHTITLPNGTELALTTADAMSIYCLSRREQALPHLLGGGIRVMGIQKGSQKAKDSRSLLTIEDVQAIISSLTDRQKQVAEGIQEFMSTVCSEWGNEISMKRFLTREFTEKFYFPIESNDENLTVKDPAAQQSDLFRLLNISATKPLTQGANNEVIIRNIFDVFTGHASDMARLNAYGMGLLDYMKWLNYRVKTTTNENQIKVRGVRKSMEKAYGKAANSYVLNLIKDVNGRASDGGDPNILMKWMRAAKTASVGNSARVATLQITSYPRAALVLSPKSLSLGLTKVPNIKRAKEYCGIALWKSFGFYDTNISRSIEDQMKGVKDVKQKLIELSLKGAEWGDAITWGALWNACEYEVAKTTKNKVGSEEFYQEVGKKLREVVYRTQVVDSNLTRSQIMRSKRGMAQEAAAFMSEPTLSANILMDAGFEFGLEKRRTGSAKSAWSKTGAYIGRAIAVYSIGQLTAALMEGLWDAWRDEDDEEFWKKYLSAFAENLALDLVPFNKLPIVSDVFEGALSIFGVGFYSSDKMSTTWLTQAVSAVDAWKDVFGGNSSATVYNALYKTLRALSSCYGVSFSGLMREGVALWNNTAGAFDPMLKILTYDRSKAELGDMLLDALIAGDDRQADSIRGKFADEEGSQSALRTAIKDRLESGDIDSGTANQYLVNYGGVKVADAYWMVKEWSFNGDAGDDFGKYDSFYTAVETGKDLKAVIKEYTDNGVTVETLKTQITEHFKPLYIEMSNSEKAGIKGYLLNAMTVLGMEREDAEEKVQEWEFESKYGFSYSDRAEAYKSGKISANELKTILMGAGEKTAEEADLQIEAYDWEKDGYEDVTMAAVREYNEYCAASDVPKDVYLHIRSFANNTENDKDANGKTIYYSAMRKIMAEIDEQYGLTASQKTAIARSLGWAEKNISKYKLW